MFLSLIPARHSSRTPARLGRHRTPARRQVHRILSSPPSSWPGRELRKYHYAPRLPPSAGCGPAGRRGTVSLALPGSWRACGCGSRVCARARGTCLVAGYSVVKVPGRFSVFCPATADLLRELREKIPRPPFPFRAEKGGPAPAGPPCNCHFQN